MTIDMTNNSIGNCEMFWTSFGLGDNESFNPSLAAALSTLTRSAIIGLDTITFEVLVTPQRHDLKLLHYLQKSTTKEVFIERNTRDGGKEDFRLKFMITALQGFNVSYSAEASKNVSIFATFNVGGNLEVMER